jgi:tRNA modification GTPase
MLGTRESATTCFSVLTPEARGAVAVIRVWGARAIQDVDSLFRPKRGPGLARTGLGRLRIGSLGAGIGDEVVVCVTDDNPPDVEIHCHGGSASVALVVDSLRAIGAEARGPEGWIEDNSRTPIEAEAHIDLGRAPTLRSAEILLDQVHGALDREVARLLSILETDAFQAIAGLESLLDRAAVGTHLVPGWRVVIAGRPNVGKSRLLNTLAGYHRAIVDPTPGTTRDGVTIRIALDGWSVDLSDTAGIHTTDDAIEAEGIALARARQAQSDLVLRLLDRSVPLSDLEHMALAASSQCEIVVANKADLPAAWEPDDSMVHSISAERGDGVERLIELVARQLVPSPPAPESGVPFRLRQVRLIEAALEALRAGTIVRARSSLLSLISTRHVTEE